MGRLLQDLRFTARALVRTPVFTIVAVITLGLGIGANTAIFSVIDGVLLEPLDYAAPERLVSIKSQFPTLGFDKFWVSPPEYRELQEWNRSFEVIGAYRTGATSIDADGQPLRVPSAFATAELFQALGVDAAFGRYFTPDEDLPGGGPAVVVSHGLWERAFGSDPGLVGRTILVNGSPATVVGVMPEGFDIDDAGVDVWRPLQLDPVNPGGRGSHYLFLVGRLRPGVTFEQAVADVEGLVTTWRERVPDTHAPDPETHRIIMAGFQDELVGDIRNQLWVLLGAVGFVLLIACANVGNLLLAKAESRQKEVAVRVALGAGRLRLVRQFLTESFTLALLGGALGLGLAYVGLRVLLAASAGSIPRLGEITLDGTVLGFTVVVSLATGVVFGLAPLFHLTAGTIGSSLREGGHRSTASSSRQRLRRLLVAGEVAMAVILVIGSGLMIRSFRQILRVDPGFRAEGLLTWQMLLPPETYPDAPSQLGFYESLLTDLEGIPGVETAAIMSGLPPRRDVNANDTEFEGLERTEEGPAHNVDYYQTVSPSYFETMEIPILEGRAFTSQDAVSDHPVALVNQRLARVFYPDMNPIGRRIRPCCGDAVPWLEIVGIVKDVKQGGIEEETGTELYFNFEQAGRLGFVPRNMNVVVRTTPPPETVAGQARSSVWGLDPSLPLAQLQTMEENLWGSVARPRFLTLLLGVFAGVALLLAAVGTYGVMSYSVAERKREIGIRMAMGAERGSVLAMILRHGLVVAGVGLVVGIGGAYGLTRLMGSFVYGITTTDPTTFVAAPAVLALVALVACWIPARRATRVDPAVVLREE